MERETKQCIDYFSQLETAAQNILIDKEQIVDYSRRSNALREAKRALQKDIKENPTSSSSWLCFGNMFIKCSKSKALDIIEKDESAINKEINSLRDGLKPKVENLKNLEGESDFKFNLKPLDKNEINAMRGILPQASINPALKIMYKTTPPLAQIAKLQFLPSIAPDKTAEM